MKNKKKKEESYKLGFGSAATSFAHNCALAPSSSDNILKSDWPLTSAWFAMCLSTEFLLTNFCSQ